SMFVIASFSNVSLHYFDDLPDHLFRVIFRGALMCVIMFMPNSSVWGCVLLGMDIG
ncbi:MAG: hypothetical protein FD173_2118, partial [Gallionellaceae bacterium]